MSEQQNKLVQIKSLEMALSSVRQQIDDEQMGIVLGDGTVKPDIVDTTAIHRLEERAKNYEHKIKEMQQSL